MAYRASLAALLALQPTLSGFIWQEHEARCILTDQHAWSCQCSTCPRPQGRCDSEILASIIAVEIHPPGNERAQMAATVAIVHIVVLGEKAMAPRESRWQRRTENLTAVS